MNKDLICSNKDCEHKGKPQPASNFNKDKKNKKRGYQSQCKVCKIKGQRQRRALKRKGKPTTIKQKEKKAPRTEKPVNHIVSNQKSIILKRLDKLESLILKIIENMQNKGNQHTPTLKERIIELQKKGLSQRNIAKELKINRSKIQRILSK